MRALMMALVFLGGCAGDADNYLVRGQIVRSDGFEGKQRDGHGPIDLGDVGVPHADVSFALLSGDELLGCGKATTDERGHFEFLDQIAARQDPVDRIDIRVSERGYDPLVEHLEAESFHFVGSSAEALRAGYVASGSPYLILVLRDATPAALRDRENE
jgi:hypothetical protein